MDELLLEFGQFLFDGTETGSFYLCRFWDDNRLRRGNRLDPLGSRWLRLTGVAELLPQLEQILQGPLESVLLAQLLAIIEL